MRLFTGVNNCLPYFITVKEACYGVQVFFAIKVIVELCVIDEYV